MMTGVTDEEEAATSPTIGMVRFDNSSSSTGLNVAGQSVADSYTVTVSLFFRIFNTSFQQKLFALGDGSGNQLNEMYSKYLTAGDVGFDFTNSGGGALFQSIITGTPVSTNVIHHLFFSVDLNHPAGSKIASVVIDGTLYPLDGGQTTDIDAAFQAGFSGGEFGLPDLTANLGGADILDFQSVWIAYGVYVAPASAGVFVAPGGGPADIGADGSGAISGVTPNYYFHGTAAQFSTNAGSGQQPTLTGTLLDV